MIYFIEAVGVGSIKIGFTAADDASERLDTLQTGCPVPLRLLGTIPGTMEDEATLHRRFAAARLQGEWFQPVPELLALIDPKELLVCGPVEVVEQSVKIRILTVGRKQFSRTLLQQLPESSIIRWGKLAESSAHDLRSYDAISFLSDAISVWGWIRENKNPNPHHIYPDMSFQWVLFTYEDRLLKCKDYFSANCWIQHSRDRERDEAFKELYETRFQIPGWQNQLFIGV